MNIDSLHAMRCEVMEEQRFWTRAGRPEKAAEQNALVAELRDLLGIPEGGTLAEIARRYHYEEETP